LAHRPDSAGPPHRPIWPTRDWRGVRDMRRVHGHRCPRWRGREAEEVEGFGMGRQVDEAEGGLPARHTEKEGTRTAAGPGRGDVGSGGARQGI
jgi:hypothetical protein